MQNKKFNNTEYKNKYSKENFDSIIFSVPKGNRELLHKYAEKNKTTANSAIISALEKEYGIDLKR